MSDCNDRYLYSRGKMFDDLKEPTLVTYTDELCYDVSPSFH
jgi:hypothetical protein